MRSTVPTGLRLAAATAALALAAVACGQKPGVHVADQDSTTGEAATGDAGTAGDTGDTTTGDAGGITDGDTGGTTTTGGDTGGTTTGAPDETTTTNRSQDTTTGGSSATTDGGASGTDGGGTTGGDTGDGGTTDGTREPQGSDRTGVGDDTLTLGIHAPVTGAAPLPAASFEQGRDKYWQSIASQGQQVLGKSQVEVLFRDDKYNPSSARQVCREMAGKAFLLVGGGGTDQIQSCAQLADVQELPYLSAGVTENGIRGLPWYFASSMSYPQQAPLLAQYVKKNFPDGRVGMIVTDTPNFDDAVQAWETAVEQQGIDYFETLAHPKGDTSWYNSFGREMDQAGVDVLFMLTSPVDYIRFAQQASQSEFSFQYVGVGITMGLNAVLNSGCPNVDDGIFFSPFPGLDWARQNVPSFFDAGPPNDDLSLALWGIAAQQHEMFQRYGEVFGNDLTREDFRALLENTQDIQTGLFPTVSYTPDDHFGASTVHVLQANCDKGDGGEHETLATFASSF